MPNGRFETQIWLIARLRCRVPKLNKGILKKTLYGPIDREFPPNHLYVYCKGLK